MNTKFEYILILAGLFAGLILPGFGQNSPEYEKFQSGFQTPPSYAYPNVYHWWLGGHVDSLRLKEEIHAFKEAGVSGFTIFEIGSRDTVLVGTGPEFLGEESLKTIQFAVEEAGKLGLEVGLNTASSWNAGGNWLTPEHAAKSIYQSKVNLSGGKNLKVTIPFPEIPETDPRGRKRMIEFGADGKPVYAAEIALLAIPEFSGESLADTSQIRDISEFFNPETEILDWEAPEGEWKIIRYVCSNSGENLILPSKYSAGPIVDHYDAEATAFHFNYIIDRLQSVLGDLRQTALKSLYMASYEARGFTWTPTLPEIFKAINGYEVKKLLPILFEEAEFSAETTANFRADFQRTLSELMIQNFYMKSKEVCHAHGLKNNSEAGGPGLPLHNVPVEPLKALGKGLDIPRGEFWINHGRYNEEGMDILRVVKEVSSAAHIYGLGIVEMEAFTSFQHWQEGPFEMKPIGDRAFAEGMNKVVVHGSTHNPEGTGFPGIVYHAGTHYNDKRVWWPKIRPFNEYLARISFILQEADFKADFLYYYGDTIPNYGGHKQGRFSPGAGYDYELVNSEILLGLEVQDGEIVNPRNGAKFRVLAMADEYEIHPEVLIKLKELAENGAVIMGPKPYEIAQRKIKPGMPNMEGWLDDLWQPFNSQNFESGGPAIYNNADPSELLESMDLVPDFDYEDKGFYKLDYTHYQKEGLDFYFVVNTREEWVSRSVTFRQQGKVPEIWDPVSGQVVAASVYEQKEQGIVLPLTLAPYESKFVVFRPGSERDHFAQVLGAGFHPPKMGFLQEGLAIWEEGIFFLQDAEGAREIHNSLLQTELDGAWEVFFPQGWGAPEKAVFPELTSWTDSEVEGIRYFSGTALYEKQFVHAMYPTDHPEARTYLDLGDLSHVAEVWLNGERLGITWTKPYRFDVTDQLLPGINTLKVEVANTWSNRITGDALTGANYTQTHIGETNIKGISHIRVPWEEAPLIPSGLFGPVTLRTLLPIALP
ncbi:glycosyl hydrolase [Cyclobacterium jeungdonense]|uniref:Glycosyl hydrolase n=1 Tax=Cyclobacterium jeungdonense TaxID=708087 RepID=A0ABT8C835_9BACT|nr:glycosyl hydrolase [Cyclobacterium jeungdonense]MDN3688517.1 glycosyl hydrolase [Cyclobacterium jeungdonense]